MAPEGPLTAPDDGTEPPRPGSSRRRLLAAALPAVAPVVVLAVVAPDYAMPYYLGMLPATTAALASPRRPLVIAVLTALLCLVAPLAGSEVWTAVLLIAVTSAALGLAAAKGWTSGGAPAATTVAILTVAPVALTDADPRTLAGSWPVALTVLAGGLWTAVLVAALTGGVRRRPHVPAARLETAFYTAALVLLTGVGTWWAVTYYPDTHSWWLLLTFYAVLVPRTGEISSRALARAGGTVLGGCVAAGLALLQPPDVVVTAVVAVGAVATVVAYLAAPLWVFAALLTVTVIAVAPGGPAVAGAGERILLTLVGAGAAAGVLVLARVVRAAAVSPRG
ncbi:FUSC family protein [Isoptericola sp. NPDC058082]|uniref:FUSC family protein n=1 Tax=Isoptericola sp. NPDC058082 TaxID=3346331 RepID=UPI0036EB8369